MKLHLNNFRLKHQLILLILISIIMMITIQVVYYYRFYQLTLRRQIAYTGNIFTQIEEKLILSLKDIEEAANAVCYSSYVQHYMTSDNNYEKVENRRNISEIIKFVKSSNNMIKDIILVPDNDMVLSYSSENITAVITELSEIYEYNGSSFKERIITNVVKNEYNSKFYFGYIVPIFNTLNLNNIEEKVGAAIILCSVDNYNQIVKKISASPNSKYYIIDSSNYIVASNELEKLGTELKIENSINNKNIIFQREKLNEFGWEFISSVPVDEIITDIKPIREFGIIIGTITSFLLVAIGVIFSKNITKPIIKIISFLNIYGEKRYHKRLEIEENNEIGEIEHHINSMLDKIETMNKDMFEAQLLLYEKEIEKKQAQLNSLQSQINPHFLYNTLDSIRSLGLLCDSQDIVDISCSMARIFRYSIKGKDIVAVKDEMSSVNDYLKIISIRFMDRINIDINIDWNINDFLMPKMIIQPIVENSIFHGFEKKLGKGFLKINGKILNENTIGFEIIDDGIGIDKLELDKIKMQINSDTSQINMIDKGDVGVGIININNRIKFICGEEYGLKIYSEKNKGTKVLIILPIRR